MIVSGSVAWESRGERGEEGCGTVRESSRGLGGRESECPDRRVRPKREARGRKKELTRGTRLSARREKINARAPADQHVSERGKRRKGKGEKRKASRKGKFSFLFLI